MIKPIETIYAGSRFRSRLEARWAVFFNWLKIRYVYEPEGYELSDGTRYLPDFYLPDQDTFFEVKGVMREVDMHKIQQFREDSHKPVVIGYDDMKFDATDYWQKTDDQHAAEYEFAGQDSSVLARCKVCGKPYFMGINGSFACRCCGAYDGDGHFDILGWGNGVSDDWDFVNASSKAKKARFEHGECGGADSCPI